MEINRDLIREAMKEGYSFYQMNGKLVIRRAGGFKKGDLKNDPKYSKVTQNASEFGRCSRMGKLLRTALENELKNIQDTNIHRRVAKLLHDIMKHDPESQPGKKTTEKGLLNNEGLALMKGFQWNEHDKSAISFDSEKHSLEFVVFPKNAVQFSAEWKNIDTDMEQGTYQVIEQMLKIQPLDQKKKYSFKKRQEHPQNLMQFLIIHFFDKTGTEIPQSCHIEYIEAKSFMQSLF
ncbi:hypothetical protein [Elizabethkingia miricola]|uniref:hypothetical protein n=1 Tax=Elizabethkingia miricola TaxID=172045 RepID=UPI000999D215|nr:hypothetical protein [Elizabethkingia miricola]OPC38140.1 hypothetical protein BAX99_05140 [Elizabethkingia miricola]